ncbi:CC/Se motif family (seleno)protein [Schnuerera sp.]|uniref:CC/Se motif family (seleno)protein n=1 Tax=Schnuerera sp. TaxID=2794844 RepID=UPI002B627DB7|nr:CC/Se motif family (seleno)protein [Schnuerera sp.]HSH34910.1 CC/Se motif family (seleno)protein [Schnuerera sp.]
MEMGKPKDESLYDLCDIEDIKVYCVSGLKNRSNQIRIKLVRFLWIKYLYVEGFKG